MDIALLKGLATVNGCKTVVLGTAQWSRLTEGDVLRAEEQERTLPNTLKVNKMRRVNPGSLSAWKLVEAVLCEVR